MSPISSLVKYLLILITLLAAGVLAARAAQDESANDKTTGREVAVQPRIDDVVSQFKFYLERLDDSLAKADDYDEADQSRVDKDAVTLAALAKLIAEHKDEHPWKASAGAMRVAANEIAVKYREHGPAAGALARIKRLQSGEEKPPEDGADASVDSARTDAPADAATLMKQIRFIDNRMKRAARGPSPSEKSRAEVAGYAATIAALADPLVRAAKPHAKSPAGEKDWAEQSAAMGAAAAKLNVAANDPAGADLREALRTLDATCARCHADFR